VKKRNKFREEKSVTIVDECRNKRTSYGYERETGANWMTSFTRLYRMANNGRIYAQQLFSQRARAFTQRGRKPPIPYWKRLLRSVCGENEFLAMGKRPDGASHLAQNDTETADRITLSRQSG
jgi:hypothetical protein